MQGIGSQVLEWRGGRRQRLFLQGREGLQGRCQLAPDEGHGLCSVQPSLLGDLYLVQFLDTHAWYCCAADCGHQVRHEAAGVDNDIFYRPSLRAAWLVPLLVGESFGNTQHFLGCQVHSGHALLAHCAS